MKLHLYYAYILTNSSNKVLYVGVTNDLERRCYDHKQKLIKNPEWDELLVKGKPIHN